MCNLCDCEKEKQERCSIKGYIPFGFCCPECCFYNGAQACMKLMEKVESKIPEGAIPVTENPSFLKKAFCINGLTNAKADME